MNYNQLINAVYSNILARMPRDTGNMARNTFVQINGNISNIPNAQVGKIVINTEYATYVNYGKDRHPNSAKLQVDYRFVERAVEESMRNVAPIMGGKIKNEL